MNLLILGGTADARIITDRLTAPLAKQGFSITYSVAGLVRTPKVDCHVITGGFTQFGGLKQYIHDHHVVAILDITHPYAQAMSNTAIQSAGECNIPCWRFHRPAWFPQGGDDWIEYQRWDQVLQTIANKHSVFFSAGQLSQSQLDSLAGIAASPLGASHLGNRRQHILRTAVKPKAILPESIQWVKAIGPFDEACERDLIQAYGIDIIVSKNSGGDSTVAKITVARELGISVLMEKRPDIHPADRIFDTRDSCEQFILNHFSSE